VASRAEHPAAYDVPVTDRWAPGLAILVLSLIVVVAACGGGPASGSPSASASAGASSGQPSEAAPSQGASPAASAPAQGGADFAVDGLATVVTNDLRVRSKPSVASDSVKFKPTLDKGRVVFVQGGPSKGSGYTWYRVLPLRQDNDKSDMPFGYVAAGDKNGTPWLGAGPPCPGLPGDYDSFVRNNGLTALACFKGQQIKFPARLEAPEATCGIDIGWTVQPDWLGSTCPQPAVLVADTDTTDSFLPIIDPKVDLKRFKPGVDEPDWVPVVITGRYDHPDAKQCKGVSTDHSTKVPLGRAQIVLGCRATFVITAIDPA